MGVVLYVIRGPTILEGFSQSYECLLFGVWDKRKCVGCKECVVSKLTKMRKRKT
jgi:hypothetical protein